MRKTVVAREDMPEEHRLRQSLGWPHLVALGVGAIVGTGILTLIGVGAGKAGPAVILSFAIAGLICACAALAYAEVATMIPASGSAYTYSYVVFGELIAWMIGVALILEYTLVVSAVAVGWSGYAAGFLKSIGLGLPDALIQGPALGGVINVPAIFIIWVVAGLLMAGTRESATVNAILVLIKMAALALFIAVTLPVFDSSHFHPFMPYGFPRNGPSGHEVGVMAAAAIIFFAFYGFDAIATAAEEAKNPGRDLAIGIVGSMVVCVIIYMAIAAAAIGAVVYTGFANSPEPLGADPSRNRQAVGGQHPRRRRGHRAADRDPGILLWAEPDFLHRGARRASAELASAGVEPRNAGADHHLHCDRHVDFRRVDSAGRRSPRLPMRGRSPPLSPFARRCCCFAGASPTANGVSGRRLRRWSAPIGILGCIYLFISLPNTTQLFFVSAQVIGLVLYFIYGNRAAERARASASA